MGRSGPKGDRISGAGLMVPVGGLCEVLFEAIMGGGPAAFARGWSLLQGGGATFRAKGAGTADLSFTPGQGRLAERELSAFNALLLDMAIILIDRLRDRPEGIVARLDVFTGPKGYTRCGAELAAVHQSLRDHLRRLGEISYRGARDGEPLLMIEFLDQHTFHCAAAGALRVEFADCRWKPLPMTVLSLDHRDVRGADVLAKKIALALASGGIDRCHRDLLARIGELACSGRYPRQGRVAVRYARAAERLRALCEFSTPEVLIRGAQKGWVQAWLDMPVTLSPPFTAHLRPAVKRLRVFKQA